MEARVSIEQLTTQIDNNIARFASALSVALSIDHQQATSFMTKHLQVISICFHKEKKPSFLAIHVLADEFAGWARSSATFESFQSKIEELATVYSAWFSGQGRTGGGSDKRKDEKKDGNRGEGRGSREGGSENQEVEVTSVNRGRKSLNPVVEKICEAF